MAKLESETPENVAEKPQRQSLTSGMNDLEELDSRFQDPNTPFEMKLQLMFRRPFLLARKGQLPYDHLPGALVSNFKEAEKLTDGVRSGMEYLTELVDDPSKGDNIQSYRYIVYRGELYDEFGVQFDPK